MTTILKERSSINLAKGGQEHHPVFLQEDGFVVKNIVDQGEKRSAYQLRHAIFCNELQWVLQSENNMESDEYDSNAVSFGVFDQDQRLVSYLRLIMPYQKFMIEKEFLSLVDPGHRIRKEPDTAEISRLCVAPHVRNDHADGNFGVHKISLALFKGVYQWCMLNGIRFLYAVTELKVYRLYCLKGFPYRLIGKPVKMPDGVVVVAVILDWEEFKTTSRAKRPELLNWFSRDIKCPLPGQERPHELCLTH